MLEIRPEDVLLKLVKNVETVETIENGINLSTNREVLEISRKVQHSLWFCSNIELNAALFNQILQLLNHVEDRFLTQGTGFREYLKN